MDDKERIEKNRKEALERLKQKDQSATSKIFEEIITRQKNDVDIDADKVLSGSAKTIKGAFKDGGNFFKWLIIGAVFLMMLVIILVFMGVLK